MSKSFYQRGFPSPYVPSYINASYIPRSYNHSSDESETGSPSGGGGGAYGQPPASHEAPAHVNYNSQVDDAPFIPRRSQTNSSFGPARDITLPSDSPHIEYYQGSPASAYTLNDVYSQSPQRFSGSMSVGPPQESRHYINRGSGAPPNYYRTHTALYVADQEPHSNMSMSPEFRGHGSVPSSGSSDVSSLGHSPGSETSAFPPNAFTTSPFPDAGEYLRNQLNIPLGNRVDLYALADPPPGQRPSQPLPVLVKLAIYGSPQKKLTLQEIYAALEHRFEWFKNNTHDMSWKNSIRHNLSLNQVFRNISRPITEPGKGKYWVLDVTNGEGYKRQRKRRKANSGSKPSSEQEPDEDEEDELSDDERSGSGSPAPTPSTARQEPYPGSRRIKPVAVRGPSYNQQPPQQLSASGPTTPFAQMSVADHSFIGSPNPQARAGPSAYAPYRQSAPGQPTMPRQNSQPSFGQPVHSRPASRAYTVPMAGVTSMSPIPYGSIQTGTGQMFRAPLRQSPTDMTHGSAAPTRGMEDHYSQFIDPRGMSPYPTEGHQSQYDPNMGMSRRSGNGSNDKGKRRA